MRERGSSSTAPRNAVQPMSMSYHCGGGHLEVPWSPSLMGRGTNPQRSASMRELAMFPPPAFESHSYDSIAVFPEDFFDLWKDELGSIPVDTSRASTDHEEDHEGRQSATCSNVQRDGPTMRGRLDEGVLAKAFGRGVQLVYTARKKNCPQGYSQILRVNSLFLSNELFTGLENSAFMPKPYKTSCVASMEI